MPYRMDVPNQAARGVPPSGTLQLATGPDRTVSQVAQKWSSSWALKKFGRKRVSVSRLLRV